METHEHNHQIPHPDPKNRTNDVSSAQHRHHDEDDEDDDNHDDSSVLMSPASLNNTTIPRCEEDPMYSTKSRGSSASGGVVSPSINQTFHLGSRSSSSIGSRNDDDDDDDDDDPRYGWCSFTPDCIQFLVNRKAFLLVFCITCVLQGTFHTYFVAVITTLEKLFSIPSKVTGTLMMGSEIGQVGSALLLPYFVGNGHRPRWIAIGSSLFSLATLMCASPHILIPMSQKHRNTQEAQYCGANSTTLLLGCGSSNGTSFFPDQAPAEDNPNVILFPIFFLSLFTIGMGQTAVYTLGIPFLDDNVASRDSPIYFSITIGVRILGPVFGFIIGSFCTRLYIYPHITPEFEPNDPRWLGAWWLGMLLISCSLFLAALVMYGFPSSLIKRGTGKSSGASSRRPQQRQANPRHEKPPEPKRDEVQPPPYDEDRDDRKNEAAVECAASTNIVATQQPQPHSSFPQTIRRLIGNRILVLRMFSCVFHLLPISGLYTFLPKYLESQFRMAAHQANLLTGTAGILVMGIGIFSSGIFIRRKEPSARAIAVWVAFSAGVYAAGMVALMFVGCNVGVGATAGHNEPVLTDFRMRGDRDFGLPNCKTDKCGSCDPGIFAPVCGGDNLVYFSPCHAGCSESDIVFKTDHDGARKLTYTNCSCVVVRGSASASSNRTTAVGHDEVAGALVHHLQTATTGLCPVTCELFPIYLTIFMVIVLVHSTSEVGSMLLTLRCVEPRDKAMALGLIQCAIGIFGNVPCPVIYGTVVDSACLVFSGVSSASSFGGASKDCVGGDDAEAGGGSSASSGQGHCLVYDSHGFRLYFHGTTAFLMFVAFLIDIVVVFHASKINIGTAPSGPDDEEQKLEKHPDSSGSPPAAVTISTICSPTSPEGDLSPPPYNLTATNHEPMTTPGGRGKSEGEDSPLLDQQRNGAVVGTGSATHVPS